MINANQILQHEFNLWAGMRASEETLQGKVDNVVDELAAHGYQIILTNPDLAKRLRHLATTLYMHGDMWGGVCGDLQDAADIIGTNPRRTK